MHCYNSGLPFLPQIDCIARQFARYLHFSFRSQALGLRRIHPTRPMRVALATERSESTSPRQK
jgi:hypothetical protein